MDGVSCNALNCFRGNLWVATLLLWNCPPPPPPPPLPSKHLLKNGLPFTPTCMDEESFSSKFIDIQRNDQNITLQSTAWRCSLPHDVAVYRITSQSTAWRSGLTAWRCSLPHDVAVFHMTKHDKFASIKLITHMKKQIWKHLSVVTWDLSYDFLRDSELHEWSDQCSG